MRAIILMFDSLNRHMLEPYADTVVDAPNFARLAAKATTFDNFYAGSLPCMPARRELHTGRYNFLHRSWGPLEPFDDSMPELLKLAGIHTHLVSDHYHYWEDGGATFHGRYNTWEFFRGQEGDPWKGVVAGAPPRPSHAGIWQQDVVNRSYQPTEATHSQTLTVDAGLHFLETNSAADQWMLQIELFDPHEPFFSHQRYKDMYPHDYDGPQFDWPPYQKVLNPPSQVEHARMEYAALVSMCDTSLGRVLDFMDDNAMWDDTMLIVNTDHGFLLGEHGWWAKAVMPWFNELVHLPMFFWDPRASSRPERRGELVQTIDIPPTVLTFFGLEPPADMQGIDIARSAAEPDRAGALFGIHGGHVNVTDGRYVYMRSACSFANQPLDEFTLMGVKKTSRYPVGPLREWQPAEPFSFTKGLKTLKIPVSGMYLNSWQYGTMLFDLEHDPKQEAPIVDDEIELRMLELLRDLMIATDSPAEQYERLGFPAVGVLGPEHLFVREHQERAAAVAVPLPDPADLMCMDLLGKPLIELTNTAGFKDVLAAEMSALLQSEMVAAAMSLTLIDLSRAGFLPSEDLVRIDQAFHAVSVRNWTIGLEPRRAPR